MSTPFLAMMIGWYMVIFSLLILIKHEEMKLIMADVMGHRGLFFVLSLFTLIIGLLLVVGHNVWVKDWPVSITIFSWFLFIGALFRLCCIDSARRMGLSFLNHPMKLRIVGVAFFLFGLYLLYYGYAIHF
jgi:hypothetical protein